jgi:hypothetical protein
MRSTHIQHRRTDAYGLVAVGYLGNTVLPARGGEVFRIFLLSERSTALKREVLGSIVAERLLDATALVFAALSLSPRFGRSLAGCGCNGRRHRPDRGGVRMPAPPGRRAGCTDSPTVCVP